MADGLKESAVARRAVRRAVWWTAAATVLFYLGLAALGGVMDGFDFAWWYIFTGRVAAKVESLVARSDGYHERLLILTMMVAPFIAAISAVLALRGGTERQDRIAGHIKKCAICAAIAALAYGGYLNLFA